MYNIAQSILRRIRGRGHGSVWTSKGFLDIGLRAAVDQALSRLVRRGVLRRLSRGVFDYPKHSPRLGTLSPDANAVVHAVAARDGARVYPSGALVANTLGLTTQVPSQFTYVTDGPARDLHLGSRVIRFQHVSPARIQWSPAVRALAYLGPDGINDTTVGQLRRHLSPRDRQRLGRDLRFAPDWMRPVLQQVMGD